MIDDTQLEKLIKITLLFSFSIFESFSLKYFPVFSIKKQNKLKIKCSMQNKKKSFKFYHQIKYIPYRTRIFEVEQMLI